eukprot:m51a1_g14584 hypothetical protein (518) ;mRNA; f:1127010-1129072
MELLRGNFVSALFDELAQSLGSALTSASDRVSLALDHVADAVESTGIVGEPDLQRSLRRAEDNTFKGVASMGAGDSDRARFLLLAAVRQREYGPALVALRLLRLANPRALGEDDPGLSELAFRAKQTASAIDAELAAAREFCERRLAAGCGPEGQYVAGAWLDAVAGDPRAAMAMYEMAAAEKHAGAICNAAVLLDTGRGCERDPARALELYRAASDAGAAMGMYNLGVCYEDGALGLERNTDEAVKLYERAAALGCAPAQLALAGLLGGERAAGLLEEAALQGDACAQVALACLLRESDSDADRARAVAMLRSASVRSGSPEAAFELGVCHTRGAGVVRDDAEAVRMWRVAYARGSLAAGVALAQAMQTGHGLERDDGEAAALLDSLAEHGDPEAQCLLGACYEEGRGVERDEHKAAEYFSKSAEQGHAGAQCVLAGMVLRGAGGLDKDEARAAALYKSAAAQGSTIAQCALAFMLESGTGVDKDDDEALRLFQQAAAAGSEEARAALERIRLQSL